MPPQKMVKFFTLLAKNLQRPSVNRERSGMGLDTESSPKKRRNHKFNYTHGVGQWIEGL